MDIEQLLTLDESATLDFKREWYKIDGVSKESKERQKGELIKDVLSLANGNANVAGETAYLVIGVSDEREEGGKREIVGVENPERITRERILDIVNAVASPHLADIDCHVVPVEQKNIVVITIHPSPHVHETTKQIKTPTRTFDEYTVFVRHGSGVRVATTKERIALSQIKQLRFDERQNVHPVRFCAVLSFFLGGLLIKQSTDKSLDKYTGLVRFLTGGIASSLLGGTLGRVFIDGRGLWRDIKIRRLRKQSRRS